MNGEMAKVLAVDSDVISKKNIPVFETINGKRIKKHITLNFRRIQIRVDHWPEDIECLILDSLLNSQDRDLTIPEMKALYIEFMMRFRDEQKSNQEKGLPSIKVGSSEFKLQLRNDLFYNALRVKYGYAITCHKAQGGEWRTTFVDYYGKAGLSTDSLRWAYTATSRAMETCYVANAPHVSTLSKFSMGDVQHLSNIPKEAFSFEQVPVSPFHTEFQHRAKSFRYWEIDAKLKDSPFQLLGVESFGGYQERYTISFNDEIDNFDTLHNDAGLFHDFKLSVPKEISWQREVLDLLNGSSDVIYSFKYSPTIPTGMKLFGLMQAACEEADVQITSVVEKIENYYIMYYLRTDAKCAFIQFYLNGNQQLTRALPKSILGQNDLKLHLLLSKLNNYVIQGS
jgi:hypothetical protein